MSADRELTRLRETAIGWMSGRAGPEEVVRAAADAVAAGAGGDALAELAGLSPRTVDSADLARLLEPAAAEIGLVFHPPNTDAAEEAYLAFLAGRVLTGDMRPRDLASWAHDVHWHDGLPMARRLVYLHDDYDLRDYDGSDTSDLDAAIDGESRLR
jgi:hypothetical protein